MTYPIELEIACLICISLAVNTIKFAHRYFSEKLSHNHDLPASLGAQRSMQGDLETKCYRLYEGAQYRIPLCPPVDCVGWRLTGSTGESDHPAVLLQVSVPKRKL